MKERMKEENVKSTIKNTRKITKKKKKKKKKKKTTKSIITKFPRIHHTFQESLPVFPWLQSHSKGNHHLHLLLHIQWRPIEFPSREVEWETLQTQSSKYNGQSPLSRRQDNDGGFEAGHGRDLITLNFKT